MVAVQACPSIEPNTGDGRQLVTATFTHSSGDVFDLHIAGEPKPIGTTANHPFWSETRQAFIPACELVEGETLRRADETITQVTRINPRRGPPTTVYNLEVNAEHVYFVGQDGVLVHNTCSIDMHHGIPRQIIGRAPPQLRAQISGVRGMPNRVAVPRAAHQAAHSGRLNGLPRYNAEFQNRLDTIRLANGGLTAADYWSTRASMLFDYFGI